MCGSSFGSLTANTHTQMAHQWIGVLIESMDSVLFSDILIFRFVFDCPCPVSSPWTHSTIHIVRHIRIDFNTRYDSHKGIHSNANREKITHIWVGLFSQIIVHFSDPIQRWNSKMAKRLNKTIFGGIYYPHTQDKRDKWMERLRYKVFIMLIVCVALLCLW